MHRQLIGIGVAGNFTGHLEQAGEVADFIGVKTDEESAPKGLFPFYLPNYTAHHLSSYPISESQILMPSCGSNIQAEPESALVCEIIYDESKNVIDLKPLSFGAFNDCSMRKKGANKISDKKNWGECSKGISQTLIQLGDGGVWDKIGKYNIASYLLRDGELHEYGVDSEIYSYSYFGEKLKDWIVNKLNTQESSGPLESIREHLKACGYPNRALISIGATRYTEFGETNYLKNGDEIYVILYPKSSYRREEIRNAILSGDLNIKNSSILIQKVLSR